MPEFLVQTQTMYRIKARSVTEAMADVKRLQNGPPCHIWHEGRYIEATPEWITITTGSTLAMNRGDHGTDSDHREQHG